VVPHQWSPEGLEPTSSAFWDDIGLLARATGALGAMDPGTVEDLLAPRLDDLRSRRAVYVLAPGLLVLGMALERLSRRREAEAHLLEALELTALDGRVGPWLDTAPVEIVPLLEREVGRSRASPEGLTHGARILEVLAGLTGAGAGPDAGSRTLSERELAVLRLVAAGRTNREIGKALFLAEGTVKKHTHNIYGKLGVRNRTGAVDAARREGLLSPTSSLPSGLSEE
jgi:LuxR family transcriptional regulator, maltose regulon positive regulatory protein